MNNEVKQLRQEVNAIRFAADLLPEVVALRKELNAIRAEIEQVKTARAAKSVDPKAQMKVHPKPAEPKKEEPKKEEPTKQPQVDPKAQMKVHPKPTATATPAASTPAKPAVSSTTTTPTKPAAASTPSKPASTTTPIKPANATASTPNKSANATASTPNKSANATASTPNKSASTPTKAASAAASSPSPSKTGKVTPFLGLSLIDEDVIRAAINEVRNKKKDWVLVGYGNGRNELCLVGSGSDGMAGLYSNLNEETQGYALVRFADETDHYVYLVYCGQEVKALKKARMATHKNDMKNLFGMAHLTLSVNELAEASPATILAEVKKKF